LAGVGSIFLGIPSGYGPVITMIRPGVGIISTGSRADILLFPITALSVSCGFWLASLKLKDDSPWKEALSWMAMALATLLFMAVWAIITANK